jgi:peroxiredoxin Q/BCP
MDLTSKLNGLVLKDQNNNEVRLSDYIGKMPVVLYFYPKDNTPGCTKQACSFRDNYSFFQENNIQIIGISKDSVDSHKDFSEKYNLPFPILSDKNNQLRKLLQVPGNLFGILPGRVTYLIDEKGRVRDVFNNLFEAEKHIEQARKFAAEIN